MADSPSKRRKITPTIEHPDDADGDHDNGVLLTAPLCECPVRTAVMPTTTCTANNAPAKPAVVEATAYLRPHKACAYHGKEKGSCKEAFEDARCCSKPSQSNSANYFLPLFRLTIPGDPVATLKRWFTNHNRDLQGQPASRSRTLRYLLLGKHGFPHANWNQSAFKPQHLRAAIKFAIIELALCHAEIEGLREYLSRAPYRFWYSQGGPAAEAESMAHWPNEQQTAALGMELLAAWLMKLAEEQDYLLSWVVDMRQDILNQKWRQAREGNIGEIEDLLRLNFVDKDMVAEHCGLPDV